MTVIFIGDGHELSENFDYRVLSGVDFRIADKRYLVSRIDQERSEYEQNPREGGDNADTYGNKNCSCKQCAYDSEEQSSQAYIARQSEVGKYNEEDKKVVDTQSLFNNECSGIVNALL